MVARRASRSRTAARRGRRELRHRGLGRGRPAQGGPRGSSRPARRMAQRVNARLVVSPEGAEAVAAGRPVVALETTGGTHDLPAPLGVQTAAAMQQAVRDAGALPALIGILEGQARVGLTADELERLAATPGVMKVNLGNLASTVSTGHAGSTTVAATIAIAHQAGVGVMATGGIGGVHRDVTETGDVSADLT